jgi:hypothetical protein
MVIPLVEAMPGCAEMSMASFLAVLSHRYGRYFYNSQRKCNSKEAFVTKTFVSADPPPERELNCRFMVGKDRLK